MQPTVPPDADELTPEKAEAVSTIIKAVAQHLGPEVRLMQLQTHQHVERVNDQARRAAGPVFWIAGGIAVAVATAALIAAAFRGDPQLARDLLLPLLSFAGGLGIGRATTSIK